MKTNLVWLGVGEEAAEGAGPGCPSPGEARKPVALTDAEASGSGMPRGFSEVKGEGVAAGHVFTSFPARGRGGDFHALGSRGALSSLRLRELSAGTYPHRG